MDVVRLAQSFIAIDSVSARSNEPVAAAMRLQLEQLGFTVEQLEFIDPAGELKVSIVAKRGTGRGGIAYFCHNDVVPVDGWNAPTGGPFEGAVEGGKLWGRGSCDMKGSAAAALVAISQLDVAQQQRPLYFVATSDEEAGMHGARIVSKQSALYREMVESGTVGIIGEPTQLELVNSHKGGCYVLVTSHGRAAHSSTSDGLNANWQLIDFLAYLRNVYLRTESDSSLQNSRFNPATLSMNVVIKNSPAASNITVGTASCTIFIRPMPDVAWESLAEEIAATATGMGLDVKPVSKLEPVSTPADRPFVQAALQMCGGVAPKTVSYATDGCWFTELKDLIILGPGSIEQAHRPDEFILLSQLEQGVTLYRRFFEHYTR